MLPIQARDLIMWVGSKPYATWEGFANEARIMGVCKRVRQVPVGIQIGVSKCYLLHGQRVHTKVESTAHIYAKVGGMCRFCGIDRTANSQNPTPCKTHLLRRTGKPRRSIYGYFVIEEVLGATEVEERDTPERQCGKVKMGAIYLKGPLTEYPEPKPWPGDTFVGFRYYTEAS
jgi:hypothetical protein